MPLATRCRRFLAAVLGHKQSAADRKINRRVLSNPMDATVVSDMLACDEAPDLFRLQQQWYQIMVTDYVAKNGTGFPLARFAERIYRLRVNDESALPESEFLAEIEVLTDHKMPPCVNSWTAKANRANTGSSATRR